MKTIFLDFDGVLHGEGKDSRGFFEHVDSFCNFMRKYKSEVEIVISSSWRKEKSLKELREIFHEDIHDMIVGITPGIEKSYSKGGREEEINMYCKNNNVSEWVALDDMERFFKVGCKNLILVDGQIGLNSKDFEELEKFLTKPKPKNKIN